MKNYTTEAEMMADNHNTGNTFNLEKKQLTLAPAVSSHNTKGYQTIQSSHSRVFLPRQVKRLFKFLRDEAINLVQFIINYIKLEWQDVDSQKYTDYLTSKRLLLLVFCSTQVIKRQVK